MSELPEVLGVCLNTHGGVEAFTDSFQADPVVYIRRDAITPAMAAEVLLESIRAKDLAIAAMRPDTLGGRDTCHHRWRSALLAIAKDKSQ